MATHAQRVARIARLVGKPSVSSLAPGWDQSNREVTAELGNLLESAGFRVEVFEVPDRPGKHNLLATFGRGEGGLVLAGHTDTVPYDLSRWTSDPFTLTEREGKLHGLGTADMKAFLALALEAVEGLNPDTLRAPVMVLATADEESTMDGARALVTLQKPRGRYAVIGEPTDMKPVRAHKGIMMERIKLRGRAGHSSDPRLGASALDGMSRVLTALLSLRDELSVRYRHPGFEVPRPTLNLGRIQGGDSANRICGACELDIDVRLLPGMRADEVRALIGERCRKAIENSGLGLEVTALVHETPAHELSPESAVLKVAEQLTGVGAESVAFATEAPYLSALGNETLVLGPGGIGEAHKPDEFVRADRLEPTVRMLQAMVEALCKTAPP